MGTAPRWVRDAVALARAGGHALNVQHPPPTFILWMLVGPAPDFTVRKFLPVDQSTTLTQAIYDHLP